MAQTISSWDAVLKEFYEPLGQSQIENKTRILKSFGEADAPTVDGRRVIFPIHIGRNSGVMSSVEGATLPTAGRQNYIDVHIPLRKVVGRINITKDVIDASKSNKGSYKRAMATEMEGLVRDISDYRNEMLCGYGTGQIATIAATASSTVTWTLKDPGGFVGTVNPNRYVIPNETVALIRAGAVLANSAVTVTSVTESGTFNTIVVGTNTASALTGDLLVRAASTSTTLATDTDYLNPAEGLFSLVDDGTYKQTLHGVNRVTYPVFKSYVQAAVGALSLDAMQRSFDAAEMKGQGNITEMWCEHSVRRAYLTLLEADRRYTSEKLLKPDGGTAAVKGTDVTFGGVPFKTERDFPYGFIVGLDTGTLDRYVNVRGQWEDEDGNILFRSANTHDFTALWYMKDNFSCSRPNANFRMDGITITALAIHVD
jgi:hypothetical protein